MTEAAGDILQSTSKPAEIQTTMRTFKRRPRPAATDKQPTTAIDIPTTAPQSTLPEPSPKRQKTAAPAKPQKQLTQVHLDLGQKNFHSTRCPTCGLVYTPGKPSDDRLHAAYHSKGTATPRYSAVSGDTVVAADGAAGEIVRLNSAKPSKSLKDLVSILESELGLVSGWLLDAPTSVFLYVCRKTRNILGCIVAENITEAWTATASSSSHPSITELSGDSSGSGSSGQRSEPLSFSSGIVLADKENTKKARHGIRMMWTCSQARRKSIATKLLDCVRCQLVRGYIIHRSELAFSQPTADGARFIKKYSSSDEFLVYDAKSSSL